MVERAKQPVLPPLCRNLYNAVRRDWIAHADPSTLVFLRAYAFGYLAETVPSVLRLVIALALAGKNANLAFFRRRLRVVLKEALGKRGLALFFGCALGGSAWLDTILRRVIARIYVGTKTAQHERSTTSQPDGMPLDHHTRQRINRLSTFLSSSLATFSAFGLQRKTTPSKSIAASSDLPLVNLGSQALSSSYIHQSETSGLSGYSSATLDFTLFLLVRAMDTLIRRAYANTRFAKNRLVAVLADKGDALLFVASAWRIMWVWFYKPWLLPPSYDRWIHSVAQIDERLLELLRFARNGEWVYGVTPSIPAAMAVGPDLVIAHGLPAIAGMPDKISTFPCQVAHGQLGNTAICEINLLRRWYTACLQGFGLYLPVHLIPVLLFSITSLRMHPIAALRKVFLGAARSSAFLATFVTGVWSGVCYGRTRLGPKIAPSQQFWDGGAAMMLGCFLCGFSVLVENKRRRGEMALFVAPRALYAVLDDVLPSALFESGRAGILERLVFSASSAVIITSSVHQPQHLRGVVRSITRLLVGDWVNTATLLRKL